MISDLAAVVTVTDDGGSSGRLRRGFNMLPPGDLRNCMVALSEDEHLISRLFRHRFTTGEGLEGHSFGNLFVAALVEITGDFAQAIKLSSQVLATRGHIYPATNANVSLAARMDDGSVRSFTAYRVHHDLALGPGNHEVVVERVGRLPRHTEAPGPDMTIVVVDPGHLTIDAHREISASTFIAHEIVATVPADANSIPYFPGRDPLSQSVKPAGDFVARDPGIFQARP